MGRGKRAAVIIGLGLLSGPVLLWIASGSVGRNRFGDVDTGKMLEFTAFWVVAFAILVVVVLGWAFVDWAMDDKSTPEDPQAD